MYFFLKVSILIVRRLGVCLRVAEACFVGLTCLLQATDPLFVFPSHLFSWKNTQLDAIVQKT